jgi:hypothetical protein
MNNHLKMMYYTNTSDPDAYGTWKTSDKGRVFENISHLTILILFDYLPRKKKLCFAAFSSHL